jgi:molybdopterin converting factor small subunit
MGIKIEIPLIMQKVSEGRQIVEVTGNTVRECLADLISQYPGTKEWFAPDNPIVWIVLNQSVVNFSELDKKIVEGDELSIIIVIGGG